MSKTVAIAGMGWLGLPLGIRLKTLGFNVKGSVTQLDKADALQKSGFEVYPFTISEDGVFGDIEGFLSQGN